MNELRKAITDSYLNCLMFAEYLFVVGGFPDMKKTEIVSLTEGVSIPDCLNALSDHPNDVSPGAGGVLSDAGKMSDQSL